MKNQLLHYTLLISLSSFNCWTQESNNLLNVNKLSEVSTASNSNINKVQNSSAMNIKYYHVEEIVLSKFGGHKTIYNVSTPLAIRTYDLGLNGKRIITPVYEDRRQQSENEQSSKTESALTNDAKSSPSDVNEKKDSNVYIDIIKTYEKVVNKGFESIEMLKKMGNSYFFENDFAKAEKCYTKLFNISADLEPFYYYRYSIVLKSVGNIHKSEEFLMKFNQLSSTASRQ